jgi:hypothetical protein
MHTYTQANGRVLLHTCIHTYIHTYTHTYIHTGKWTSLVESLVVFSFLREAGELQSALQALEAYVTSNSLGALRPQPPVDAGVLSAVAFV